MSDDVPIPVRMMRRPCDARGLLVPYAQFVTADGTPDFRILDAEKLDRCLRLRLCGLCGEPMGRHIFFVGGPACISNGYFYDPPMHQECAVFALRACAHLNRAKGRYNTAKPLPQGGGLRFVEGAMDITHKAEWFALMHTIAYTFGRQADGMMLIKAELPWIEIERWRDGAPMAEE